MVANCHQLPESHFLRYRLSVEEIVEDYTALITEMSALNPAVFYKRGEDVNLWHAMSLRA